jgi:hypothetical protein
MRKGAKSKLAAKVKKATIKSKSLSKALMEKAVRHIALEIIAAQPSVNDRTPRGFAEKLLKEAQETLPKLTMNKINYAIKNLKEQLKNGELHYGTGGSNISSLTEDNNKLSGSSDQSVTSGSTTSQSSNSSTSTSSDIQSKSSDASSASKDQAKYNNESLKRLFLPEDVVTSKKTTAQQGGRPKGTTEAATKELERNIELATQESVLLFKEKRKENRSSKKRLRYGLLDDIIKSAKKKFSVPDDVTIRKDCIRQRVKRNSSSNQAGQQSPMIEIEPYLVELIIKLSSMRMPITSSQGLELANSLIAGTSTERKVVEWKKKNCAAFRVNGTNKLGKGYWQAFLRRNKHLIRGKKSVKFDDKRAQWCTYDNMLDMYTEVYKDLCSAGLACEHEEPVWRNAEGEIVESEADAFGLKSKFELIHPDMLIFVDELGCNTNQKQDGDNEKYLCPKSGRPQQRSATKDSHFTVLGFTAADGNPLMCAIIFAAKSLREEWVSGFDPFSEWVGDENNLAENCGEGKQYPFGPSCTFKGKEVPCFCCCSENGSITGQLLTNMLRYIDSREVFDRSTGLNPFLLLDGHGSRFDLEFLEYVIAEDTKWHVELGLPYGTSYWQVGDSSEQNGSFKMKLTKEKAKLTSQKYDAGLSFEIDKRDIVKLVKECWKHSFAKVDTNRKAVLTRGWGPKTLSYNCLLHKEIAATKNSISDSSTTALTSTIDPTELNTHEGFAGTLIERICIKYNDDANQNGVSVIERKKKRQETAKEKLEQHGQRISAGLLVSSGQYRIDDTVHGYVKRVEDKRKQQEQEAQRKRKEAYFKLKEKVDNVRQKSSSPDKWNSGELATMIQWFRRKGDAAIPKTVAERRQRYLEICGRAEPNPPEVSDGNFDAPSESVDQPIQPTTADNVNGDPALLPDIELGYESHNEDAAMLLFFADTNAVEV